MPSQSPMDLALSLAEEAASHGEAPVGAVVMEGETVLAAERTRMKALGDLYVTLEPCAMCAGAIAHARLRRLYFAAEDIKAGAVENGIRLFAQPTCHHAPEVISGLGASRSEILLRDFFRALRE